MFDIYKKSQSMLFFFLVCSCQVVRHICYTILCCIAMLFTAAIHPFASFRTTQHFKNSMATHALIDASIVPLDEGVGHNPVVLFLTPKF